MQPHSNIHYQLPGCPHLPLWPGLWHKLPSKSAASSLTPPWPILNKGARGILFKFKSDHHLQWHQYSQQQVKSLICSFPEDSCACQRESERANPQWDMDIPQSLFLHSSIPSGFGSCMCTHKHLVLFFRPLEQGFQPWSTMWDPTPYSATPVHYGASPRYVLQQCDPG